MLAPQLKLAEWDVAWTPVPERVMVLGKPVAVLAMVTLPLSVPEVLGPKITPKVILWPGDKETGVPAPLRVNPVPLSVICETVTFELPEFVSATLCVDEDPALTLPKARFVALSASDWVAGIPIPLTAMVDGEFGALLTMVTLPLTDPADVGAN